MKIYAKKLLLLSLIFHSYISGMRFSKNVLTFIVSSKTHTLNNPLDLLKKDASALRAIVLKNRDINAIIHAQNTLKYCQTNGLLPILTNQFIRNQQTTDFIYYFLSLKSTKNIVNPPFTVSTYSFLARKSPSFSYGRQGANKRKFCTHVFLKIIACIEPTKYPHNNYTEAKPF